MKFFMHCPFAALHIRAAHTDTAEMSASAVVFRAMAVTAAVAGNTLARCADATHSACPESVMAGQMHNVISKKLRELPKAMYVCVCYVRTCGIMFVCAPNVVAVGSYEQ